MRDPYVHAEKTSLPGFGHQAIRALITDVLGVVPDLPKTVGTGCGVRRPLASTSTVPEEITCLACREWLRGECLFWADTAARALELAARPDWPGSPTAPAQVHHAVMAGATWGQIAAAAGSDPDRARHAYRGWAAGQHRLRGDFPGGTIGLDDEEYAAALEAVRDE